MGNEIFIYQELEKLRKEVRDSCYKIESLLADANPVGVMTAKCTHSYIEMLDGTFKCEYCPAQKESDGKNI